MTTSNEAIAAAREIYPDEPLPFWTREDELERIASIIQKHYAAKDAEIEQLKIDIAEIRRQHQQEASEWKTDEELTARVAELEKALNKACNLTGYMRPCDFVSPKKGEEFVAAAYEIANLSLARSPSSALTHLQELERKAKALDWLDANRTGYIYDHFKYNSSNAANCKTWLSAIESAMEKQK